MYIKKFAGNGDKNDSQWTGLLCDDIKRRLSSFLPCLLVCEFQNSATYFCT